MEESAIDEHKLLMMIEACYVTGFSLEVLARLTHGLDVQALEIFCRNLSEIHKIK